MTETAEAAREGRLSDTGAALAWEDRPRTYEAKAVPILSIEGFEGPLDWLLEMARARKLDLARLSIAALIEAFVAAMELAFSAAGAERDGGATLARWSDWLVMAASLALLRSRLLLPADTPEARDAEIEAEALRRQLVDRAQVRAAADWLERRLQLGQDVFGRGMPDANAPGQASGGHITELLRACLVALRLPERVDAYRPRPLQLWRVPDAIARMRRLLGVVPDGSPLAAFLPQLDGTEPDMALRRRAAVASTLVAGLELVRNGVLTLEQDGIWTMIEVHRRESLRTDDGAERAT